jgi:hypothetical protein
MAGQYPPPVAKTYFQIAFVDGALSLMKQPFTSDLGGD